MTERTIRDNFEWEVKHSKLGIWEQSVMLRCLDKTQKISLRGETTYLIEVNEIAVELDFEENICILGGSFLNYLIFPTEREKQTCINALHFILFGMKSF